MRKVLQMVPQSRQPQTVVERSICPFWPSRMFFYLFIPCVALLLAPWLIGCNQSSPVICFVLPDAYRGAFLVQTGLRDGVSLQQSDGVYQCVIPDSGNLTVKGDGHF